MIVRRLAAARQAARKKYYFGELFTPSVFTTDFRVLALLFAEGRVEGALRGLKVDVFDELAGFACSGFAIHAAVFPFNR